MPRCILLQAVLFSCFLPYAMRLFKKRREPTSLAWSSGVFLRFCCGMCARLKIQCLLFKTPRAPIFCRAHWTARKMFKVWSEVRWEIWQLPEMIRRAAQRGFFPQGATTSLLDFILGSKSPSCLSSLAHLCRNLLSHELFRNSAEFFYSFATEFKPSGSHW